MIVVSCYTPQPGYVACAARLKASLERFGLRGMLVEVKDPGNWVKATHIKPSIIIDVLCDAMDDVLAVDIDCEFLCDPRFPEWRFPWRMSDDQPDVAVYDWLKDPDNVKGFPVNPNRQLCSGGVMFFSYSAPAMNLLRRWNRAVRSEAVRPDDQVFDEVVNGCPNVADVQAFPKTMNWMPALFGPPPADCVVLHHYQNGAIRDAQI
jgi:hypothetical protein